MKARIRSAISSLAGRCLRREAGRVVVLCYHSVHPTKSFASATPERFGQQLDWIRAHCEVIPFSRVLTQARAGGGTRPKVAITFDDGYADNHRFAFPMLVERGISATFFLTTGLLDKDPAVLQKFQRERGCSYADIRPLEWAQIREMAGAGMDIGAHTYSHPNLLNCAVEKLQRELLLPKARLEEQLGRDIESFAYPYGKPRRAYDVVTMRRCAEAGYRYVAAVIFRNVRANDTAFAIPRLFVTGDEPSQLAEKVLGAWDVFGAFQERAPRWLAQAVSPQDFRYPS